MPDLNAQVVTKTDDDATIAFSVIIGRVSTEDGARILETLESLATQLDPIGHEVIVADRLQDAVSAEIRRRHPGVVLIDCPATMSLPELRYAALARSRGAYIVVTEDHCVPPRTWLADFSAVLRDHPGLAAVAGNVENGITERTLDWATYLCEYAAFAPPIGERRDGDLAGMNVAYRRDVLMRRPRSELTSGFWETTVHPRLRAEGEPMLSTDLVRIRHCKRFSLGLFARQRYVYSRYFAGIRFDRNRRAVRLIAALSTPVLPVLLTVRLLRAARRKPSVAGPAVRAVPYLLLFYFVWTVGEAVGYAFGPGTALREIE